VLKVAGERFRMLQRNEAENTEKIASGEFLDRLILKNVGTQDSGMYICFVTSNGIGQLTYKSVDLNVVPCKFFPENSEKIDQQTISSTFYERIFCTKLVRNCFAQLFSTDM